MASRTFYLTSHGVANPLNTSAADQPVFVQPVGRCSAGMVLLRWWPLHGGGCSPLTDRGWEARVERML